MQGTTFLRGHIVVEQAVFDVDVAEAGRNAATVSTRTPVLPLMVEF